MVDRRYRERCIEYAVCPGQRRHVGNLSLKTDATVDAGLPGQANAARRDINSRHAKTTSPEIDHVPSDPTAKIENKTLFGEARRPIFHGRVRSCVAPIAWVSVAMSP